MDRRSEHSLARLSVIAMVLVAMTGSAWAQEAGLLLKLDTEYERTEAPTAISGLKDVQTVGLSIDAHGRMGTGHVSHAAFLDAHFGAGWQGGFAYRFSLLPLGLALYDRGQRMILSVAGGISLQGVTAHQPFGVLAPLRVSLISRLGDHVLVDAWATNEISLGNKRDNTPEYALFGDEVRAGFALRLGKSGHEDYGRQQVTYGSGYFVGVEVAERLGTRFWGLSIGHGMNMRGTSGRRIRSVPVQRER